ncbi:ABC-three component system middle component 8 [Paenarthrobacter sp. NPDC057981]|uniref:ABC-three component system middle component 8 n=1 Tax=Paenarthrobacter sp. NPDC057981 TaxID=3346297 RepID=UPI0036DBB5C0
MLFPGKHEHPDQTVIALASTMMKYLARHQVVKYDVLFEHCNGRGHQADYLFTPALNLLYLLGVVDYLPKADSFEWIRKASS